MQFSVCTLARVDDKIADVLEGLAHYAPGASSVCFQCVETIAKIWSFGSCPSRQSDGRRCSISPRKNQLSSHAALPISLIGPTATRPLNIIRCPSAPSPSAGPHQTQTASKPASHLPASLPLSSSQIQPSMDSSRDPPISPRSFSSALNAPVESRFPPGSERPALREITVTPSPSQTPQPNQTRRHNSRRRPNRQNRRSLSAPVRSDGQSASGSFLSPGADTARDVNISFYSDTTEAETDEALAQRDSPSPPSDDSSWQNPPARLRAFPSAHSPAQHVELFVGDPIGAVYVGRVAFGQYTGRPVWAILYPNHRQLHYMVPSSVLPLREALLAPYLRGVGPPPCTPVEFREIRLDSHVDYLMEGQLGVFVHRFLTTEFGNGSTWLIRR